MTLSLACSGWINDDPPGNRLRWQAAGTTKLEIQRAPLKPWNAAPPTLDPALRGLAPLDWWAPLGSVDLRGNPYVSWTAPTPAQAVCFAYAGADAPCLVIDPDGRRVACAEVRSGGSYTFTGARIGQLRILVDRAQLDHVHLLDLAADRDLPWVQIATVPQFPPNELAAALTRLPGGALPPGVAIDDAGWAAVQLMASGSFPPDMAVDDRLPGPADVAALLRSTRFWMAVLAGTGYVDGPRTVDDLVDGVVATAGLAAPQPVAYRVLDPAAGTVSNLAVSPGWAQPDLPAPTGVTLRSASVRLADTGGQLEATLVSTCDPPPWPALGFEYERQYSASPATGAAAADEITEHRGLPPHGTTMNPFTCTDPVAAWDVTAAVRYAVIDGWDRVSPSSVWTAARQLDTHHFAVAPWFAAASQTATGVQLVPAVPAWTPDAFIARVGGNIVIRRQIGQPAVRDATITGPALTADESTARVTLDPPLDPDEVATYTGGTLTVGGQTYSIALLDSDGAVVFIVRDSSGAAIVPEPAAATLQQAAGHLTMWHEVARLPAVALPATLDVTDPWAPGDTTRVYAATVDFDPGGGRDPVVGPLGATVRCLGWQPRPDPPPAIAARALVSDPTGRADLDAYGRVLVEVTFAADVPFNASYTIWWCEGDPDRFQATRSAGISGPQQALDGRRLIDALPLPVPLPAVITIGVTRVTDGHLDTDPTMTILTLPSDRS